MEWKEVWMKRLPARVRTKTLRQTSEGTLLHEEEKLLTQSGLCCNTFDSNRDSIPMVHGTESKTHGRKE